MINISKTVPQTCLFSLQVMKNEGFMSLMKGAGANILRGVAGAGVLAGFDKFKELYIKWRLTLA